MPLEKRLIELETKIAFQDNTLEELSDVLYQQQLQITELNKVVERLKTKLLDPEDENIRDNEKPPHY